MHERLKNDWIYNVGKICHSGSSLTSWFLFAMTFDLGSGTINFRYITSPNTWVSITSYESNFIYCEPNNLDKILICSVTLVYILIELFLTSNSS